MWLSTHSIFSFSVYLTIHPYGRISVYKDLMKYNREAQHIWEVIYHIIESTNWCHDSVPPLWLFSVVAVPVFWDNFWFHRGSDQSCCVISTSWGSFHWERYVLKYTFIKVSQNFQTWLLIGWLHCSEDVYQLNIIQDYVQMACLGQTYNQGRWFLYWNGL